MSLTAVSTPPVWLRIAGPERRGVTGGERFHASLIDDVVIDLFQSDALAILLACARRLKKTACNARSLALELSSSRAEIVESADQTSAGWPLLR